MKSRAGWPAPAMLVLGMILTFAVLAPPIALPGGLPELRLEQLLAVPAGVWLVMAAVRSRTWRAAARAWLLPFAPLMAATAVSIAYAAAILNEPVSPRDAFEVAKLGIYAVLFGFAQMVCRRPERQAAALTILLGAGIASALVGLAQYLDLPGFVAATGGWWAPEHHLRALERDGRAFGTIGNPNYFGALMALLATVALTLLVRGRGAPGRHLATVALAAGTLGVVLSGSRGALAMLLCATAVALGLALRAGAQPRRALAGAGTLAGVLVLSVLFVELLPRGREGYLSRVAGAFSPGEDSGLALRLERWRSLIGREHAAAGAPPAAAGPPASTGRPAAGPEAVARDVRRKADVQALVTAVQRYRGSTGDFPASLGALLPGDLAALPADPSDGAAYAYELSAGGFTVAARLENPADVDFPLYATGDRRNLLRNGSAEEGDGQPAGFRTIAGTRVRREAGAALYGGHGLRYWGSDGRPERRAAVYQQRFLNRRGGTPYTAALWVRYDAPVQGEVFLYANLYYTDGSRQDPYARVAADPAQTGVWQRLTLTITPDPSRQIDFLGVYLLSDHFQGEVSADGFTLVDGSVPVSFTGLAEGAPAGDGGDAVAGFRRSPLFGGGPAKAEGGAAIDNEYLLVLGRYGLVGMAAYLWLWGLTAWRAVRAGVAAVAGVIAGLLLFSLVAGSLYQMQLMDVFWPLAGVLLAASGQKTSAAAATQSGPSTPGIDRAAPAPPG